LLSLPRGAFSHSICIIHGGLKLVFQDCPRNRDYLQAQRMTNREDKHDSLRSNGCRWYILSMSTSFQLLGCFFTRCDTSKKPSVLQL
jgi:hypothetical protein